MLLNFILSINLINKYIEENNNKNSEKSLSINQEENRDGDSYQIQLIRMNSNAENSDSSDDNCGEKNPKENEPDLLLQNFIANDKFQNNNNKVSKNCTLKSMKDISVCTEFKEDECDNEPKEKMIHLHCINRDEADSNHLNIPQLEFKKRKRIMSNIDNNVGTKKKKVSPKKKRKIMRKCSITNSDFKSFYNSFEQQLKSTNMESNNSNSLASSELCSNQTIERFSPDTKLQRINESCFNKNYESNSLVEKRLSQFSHQRSVKISNENNQEANNKKLNLIKIHSMRKKTIDLEPYDTVNLLSIMGKLSQIEDKISN